MRGSGTCARVLFAPWILLLLAALIGGSTSSDLEDVQNSPDRSMASFVPLIFVLLVVLLIRSLMLGVYLTPEHIFVKSWFFTYRYARSEVAACRPAPWESWVNRGNGGGMSSLLAVVAFEKAALDGKSSTREMNALVSPRKTAFVLAGLVSRFASAPAVDADEVRSYARGERNGVARHELTAEYRARAARVGRHR